LNNQRIKTFKKVKQKLKKGIIRAYNREFIQTHLMVHQAYRAREKNVRAALRKLNT